MSMTEKEMREAKVPWPKTANELAEYIEALVSQEHDYGTCVYAMSMAAVAAFYYVAHRLGVSGFQASCADMDILRRTRGMKGGFIIFDAENLLYPQYDLQEEFDKWVAKQRDWLRDEAKKKLAESNGHVNSDVRAHWESLAT